MTGAEIVTQDHGARVAATFAAAYVAESLCLAGTILSASHILAHVVIRIRPHSLAPLYR